MISSFDRLQLHMRGQMGVFINAQRSVCVLVSWDGFLLIYCVDGNTSERSRDDKFDVCVVDPIGAGDKKDTESTFYPHQRL